MPEKQLPRQDPSRSRAARTSSAPTAANLFPQDTAATHAEAKPTLESLFGPEPASKPDETLNAEQVFRDGTPSLAGQKNEEEHKED